MPMIEWPLAASAAILSAAFIGGIFSGRPRFRLLGIQFSRSARAVAAEQERSAARRHVPGAHPVLPASWALLNHQKERPCSCLFRARARALLLLAERAIDRRRDSRAALITNQRRV